jgi:membrane fusion protein, multidrug efflux system
MPTVTPEAAKEEEKGQKPQDENKSSDSAEKSDDTKEKEEEKKPVDPATKRRRLIIGIGVGIGVLIAGIAWWLYSRTYESTDDAQINGTSTPSRHAWPGR